ncbi:MAG: TetR/AcrR family transcriptional regulator [Acidimicrobiales bacterium]
MEPGLTWQTRALDRSLAPARARALQRSEKLIAAATELLHETGGTDFTVQDVVARASTSLRAFYQHFAGKDELLAAVLEEAIASFVVVLREQVAARRDPVAKLRAYVLGFYGAGGGPHEGASRALSRHLLSLTQANPSELARILEPQVSLLAEIVGAGVASGELRSDVPADHLTVLLNQTVMGAVEMRVLGAHLGGEAITGEELWGFCSRGVLAPGLA